MRFSSRLAAFALFALCAAAQAPGVAHLSAPKSISAPAHATATAVFTIAIEPGFHIQSDHPSLDYLIPTAITFDSTPGVTYLKTLWPAAQAHKFSFSADPLTVFEGTIQAKVEFQTAAPGAHVVHGTFRYQACNDQLCRPPVSVPIALEVRAR